MLVIRSQAKVYSNTFFLKKKQAYTGKATLHYKETKKKKNYYKRKMKASKTKGRNEREIGQTEEAEKIFISQAPIYCARKTRKSHKSVNA